MARMPITTIIVTQRATSNAAQHLQLHCILHIQQACRYGLRYLTDTVLCFAVAMDVTGGGNALWTRKTGSQTPAGDWVAPKAHYNIA